MFQKNQCECHLLHFISIKLQTPQEHLKTYDSVILNNIKYKQSYFVATNNTEYVVYKIINIIVLNQKVSLFCQKIKNSTYVAHYSAFQINPKDLREYEILKINSLIGPPTTLINTASGKFMLRFKQLY